MVSTMTRPPSVRVAAVLVCLLVAQHRDTKKRTGRKSKDLYSEGQRNALIDAVMDPLAEHDDIFVLIDSLLHFLNEGATEASVIKFAKYTLPELLRRWLKKRA